MFEELSDGIYFVVKNRFGDYMPEYVKSSDVMELLNNKSKVVVVYRGGGRGFANWNFDIQGRVEIIDEFQYD